MFSDYYIHYNFDFVLLLCSLFTLVIIFTSPNKLYKDMFPIERLSNSWSRSPLDSIFHINSSNITNNCSSMNVNSTELINFDWQHTDGCDCSNINHKHNNEITYPHQNNFNIEDVYKSLCDSKQLALGCKNINKSKLMNAKIWKKVKLCYTTHSSSSKYTNYFSFHKVGYKQDCPITHPTKCGMFDTLNNTMCLKLNEKCPINYLAFKSRFNEIILKPDFFNNNNEYGTIYSDIAILDGLPCINFKEAENNDINQYILSVNKKRSKCITYVQNQKNNDNHKNKQNKIYHDTRFTQIDEYPKQQFYEENDILNYIYHLPNYPVIRNKSIKFFAGVYIGWDNSKCGDNLNLNMLDKINDIKLFIIKSVYTRKVIILVIIFICLTYIGGISLYKYNKISDLGSIINTENKYILIVVYSLYFMLNLVLWYFISKISKFCLKSNVNSFMELVRNNTCSDDVTNMLLTEFANKYFHFLDKIYMIMYLSYISLGTSLMMIVYIIIKSCCKKEKGLEDKKK